MTTLAPAGPARAARPDGAIPVLPRTRAEETAAFEIGYFFSGLELA